jgi:probable rRNA maturation factor
MTLDIAIQDARWEALSFDRLVHEAVLATLDYLGLNAEKCEVSVLGCDDSRIAQLNAEFRGKTVATNVLSWPAADLTSQDPGLDPRLPTTDFTGTFELGDIAISYETSLREAEAAAKPLANHVRHLIVHGVLHLLGYDHVRDPDATLMERLEVDILGKLGVEDPYCGTD